jgi:HlyD family secretion protein
VLSKYAETGEIAAPGRALYKIADLSVMELKIYVSGTQLPAVKQGQQVEVLIDADKKTNRKLNGIVSWISPKAEFTPKIIQTKEERVNLVYGVKIRVPNDGSLKIAMPAEVNFIGNK